MTETIKTINQLEKMASLADSEFSKNASVYCFLDMKSGLHKKIFECDSDTNAIRIFYDIVGVSATKGDLISNYPEDFALVKLCDFDYLKGLFNLQTYVLMKGSEARAYNLSRESEVKND